VSVKNLTFGVYALGGLLMAYGVYRVARAGPGLLSGDNALTRGATDASGAPTSAYVGQGAVGTVGAAANAASGGVLASFGGWLGRGFADLTLPDPMKTKPAQRPAVDRAILDRWSLGSRYSGAGMGSADPFVAHEVDVDVGNGTGFPVDYVAP
jgi:hypothetical protein